MTPELQAKMQTFMYFLTKGAARDSFIDFLEFCDISEEEYRQIKEWFKENANVTLYI